MSTATTESTKALNTTQRDWLKQMGAVLNAPISDSAPVASSSASAQKFGIGPDIIIDPAVDLLKTLIDPHSCQVRIVNDTGQILKLDSQSLQEVDKETQIGLSHGKWDTMPPNSLPANEDKEFKASSNTILGKTLTGVEGRTRYFIDEQKTAWVIHFNNPFKGSNTADAVLEGPNKDQFEAPKPVAGKGNDAAYSFTLQKKGGGGGGGGGGQTPAVDAASMCMVTIQNDTKLVLTLGGQGHERGDFLTFPAKTLQPGANTQFISTETPNSKDPKDEGCKGFTLWQVGSPNTLWRVEWDNPEGSKNLASHGFNPPNVSFTSLDQIGQGEENVPVSFTLQGGGGGVEPPTTTSKLIVTVVAAATKKAIEGATVVIAATSVKTNATGKAEFSLPPGSQTFKASAPNFADKSGTTDITSGRDKEIDVELEAGAKTGKLFVSVLDFFTQQPIVGATVDFSGNSSKTDKNGQTQFALPPGDQPFKATADNFDDLSGSTPIVADQDNKLIIMMQKGKKPESDFTPPPESKQPTLRKGDESADGWVEYLQAQLVKFLGDAQEINGKFDDKTEANVKKFQQDHKPKPLLVDGVVGNQTWAALRKAPDEAVGTDGRKPHTFEEKGPQARWPAETTDPTIEFDPQTDVLFLVVVSVGEGKIDDFEARVRVTQANGKSTVLKPIKIGPPTKVREGGGAVHKPQIPNFRGTFGTGVITLEAFLPAELGGDNFKDSFTIE